jgi:hypothetical protein
MGLYNLQKSGYPFRANDISYQEWMDLGRVRQIFDARNIGCPMMGGKA